MTILTDCNGIDGMGPGHALPIGARMTEKAPQSARPAACFPPISPTVFHFPPLHLPPFSPSIFSLRPCICISVCICIHIYQQVRGGVRARMCTASSMTSCEATWAMIYMYILQYIHIQYIYIYIYKYIYIYIYIYIYYVFTLYLDVFQPLSCMYSLVFTCISFVFRLYFCVSLRTIPVYTICIPA